MNWGSAKATNHCGAFIYVDNKQSISFSKNITVNSKLRTVNSNLKDKRIQEMRDDKVINAKYVLGIENPADLLTKVINV